MRKALRSMAGCDDLWHSCVMKRAVAYCLCIGITKQKVQFSSSLPVLSNSLASLSLSLYLSLLHSHTYSCTWARGGREASGQCIA